MGRKGWKFDRTNKVTKYAIRYWKQNLDSKPNWMKKCRVCLKGRITEHHLKCNKCWDEENLLN